MYWAVAEYLLKGLFLGLLSIVALAVPSPAAAGVIGASSIAGLVLGVLAATVCARQDAIDRTSRWPSYLLFLLLEYPQCVFIGCIGGLALSTFAVAWPEVLHLGERLGLFTVPGALLAVGLNIGVGLHIFQRLKNPSVRFCLAAGACCILTATAIYSTAYCSERGFLKISESLPAICLLAGVPILYFLTFVAKADESEADVAAWCVPIGCAVYLLSSMRILWLAVLLSVFFLYVVKVLSRVRVLKHTLRGITYGRVGLHGRAMRSLNSALQFDPANSTARSALWDLHRRLDPVVIEGGLLQFIDAHMCVERASQLLNEPPKENQREEALRLLDLAERREPRFRPRILYWRAVAATHANDLDTAARHLNNLLDMPDDAERHSTLINAWQLILLLHTGLESRVGQAQLAKPGRRLEAIAAAERTLATAPDDPTAWSLKRVLYAPITEADFQAGPVTEFDFAYAQQLGLAQVDDPARFRRGVQFLAIAARGMPAEAPCLWHKIAEVCATRGDVTAMAEAREQGKRAGLAFGPKQLPEQSRHSFYSIIKTLADESEQAGNLEMAANNLSLFADYERSGLETLRALADLHERRGDPLAALLAVERARLYSANDTDLLERRDKYVYSIDPATLQQASDAARSTIDVNYCLDKARKLIDLRDADAQLLDWARHLTQVALVIEPRSFSVRLLAARVRLRLGERDVALQMLEDVREKKPAKFASSADEDAWRMANRLLADLYLDELDRPDLAVGCLQEFRQSSKSGADTLYKLGLAHERLNERPNAAKYYEMAASYEDHPRAADARAGLRRVR